MEDNKVYYPEVIQDTPFPNDEVAIDNPGAEGGDTISPAVTKDQAFPVKRIAQETVSQSLNTRSRRILAEFQFTEMGAIQIGKYQNGISGDLRISPNGLVARNQAGEITVAIDGTTGDATFKGTLQTGTLVSGEVIVGNNNVIIDGDSRRIIINDGVNDRILIGYLPGMF